LALILFPGPCRLESHRSWSSDFRLGTTGSRTVGAARGVGLFTAVLLDPVQEESINSPAVSPRLLLAVSAVHNLRRWSANNLRASWCDTSPDASVRGGLGKILMCPSALPGWPARRPGRAVRHTRVGARPLHESQTGLATGRMRTGRACRCARAGRRAGPETQPPETAGLAGPGLRGHPIRPRRPAN
jgi:hypothetical protein